MKKVSHFPVGVFMITFFVLVVFTTIQNKILGAYIDFTQIPASYVVIITIYWIFISAAFTIFTRRQIIRSYEKPLKQFAKATKEVAGGDFSVYVRPLHTADKADYLDVMIDDFNKMVAELGSIETLKTEFFSNVSHEIKTPLSGIQNYAELLLKDSLTESQRKEYASAIVQSSKKLSGLITNILKLNKLEQQTIQSVPSRYDLCAQLAECALQFEGIWESTGIEFEADIEDKAIIEADENLMELVWNNLLSNAFKFTGETGTVAMKQTSTDDEAVVRISDTGCGMSEETISHIFDKFYQGDTSHAMEGNGLGLPLALRVLQIAGATINVRSVVGEGSEFTVRIPGKVMEDGRQ